MNKDLKHLLPYPFERLRSLLAGTKTPSNSPIPLHILEVEMPFSAFYLWPKVEKDEETFVQTFLSIRMLPCS